MSTDMIITDYERDEWARLAASAYAAGKLEVADWFLAYSTTSLQRIPWQTFDRLMTMYRRWLIADELPDWSSTR